MNSFYKRRFALLIIISIVVIAALTVVAAVIGVNMFGYDFKGSGTEADPYLISSDADMKALSIMSSTGDSVNTEGKYYKLTRDVKVYGANRNKSINGFSGVFDGDGHTVKIVGAMFNKLNDGAVIRNTTLAIDCGVEINNKFSQTKLSYIAHYDGANGARIEKVAIDYDLVIDYEEGTGKNSTTPTVYSLIRSGSSTVFSDCDIDIYIVSKCGSITNRTAMFYPLGNVTLEGCTASVKIDAEFGNVATHKPTIDFTCSAKNSKLDYTINMIDRQNKSSAAKWDYKDYTFDEAFSYSGFSVQYGKFYETNDYDIKLNWKYAGSVDCIENFYHNYVKSSTVETAFALNIDYSDISTFEKDGCVFAERGGAVYLLEYVGDGEEVTVPSFDGKYKSYYVNTFAFYNKNPRKVTYPEEITAIGGKPYGNNIAVIVYRGTKEQYKNIDTAYNRPFNALCPIVCSNGNYKYN